MCLRHVVLKLNDEYNGSFIWRESHLQNLQGAFSVKCALPPNACILLVDDIYTTGSTVDEAARCLQAAGECKVYVAAVAIGG